ncbi:hypothetical protein MBCUR_10040 [Methanobrevibacter curvatus]|uniref:Uncharacterized protein n=1 Tax=Methanobrevibacter curvatus TaxID=49547 RepID=A0A166AXE5_9EURY|nr:hypothetical protein MBCUR_10040 [Methanobrevibacter curvatus]
MTNENDFILLTSFVAIGIIVLGLIVSLYDSVTILPIFILGIILFVLILLQRYHRINHITENIEKIVFIGTLIFIIISLIFLYKPI